MTHEKYFFHSPTTDKINIEKIRPPTQKKIDCCTTPPFGHFWNSPKRNLPIQILEKVIHVFIKSKCKNYHNLAHAVFTINASKTHFLCFEHFQGHCLVCLIKFSINELITQVKIKRIKSTNKNTCTPIVSWRATKSLLSKIRKVPLPALP